jgi:hypothetical protein
MSGLSKRDRGCWLVFAYAPKGVSMSDANDAFNRFVAEPARGLVLFHDHFADRAGGVAVFNVEEPAELAALRQPGPLGGWELHRHPLIFAESAPGFLFQVDFTMTAYRKRRLPDLWEEYAQSDLKRRNDERVGEGGQGG